MPHVFLGLDFGTESVRAVLCDPAGRTLASAVAPFSHGQIVPGSSVAATLFDHPLPPAFALQHPADWLDASADACRRALESGHIDPASVSGIGVDFTSCTMLPCRADGTPLCLAAPDLARDPHAWPKLWKHHGALEQTVRLNALARQRQEPWLPRYGGVVGLEWFFPKMLEVIDRSPQAAEAAEVWLEGGDWFVWQLVGSPFAGGRVTADALARSTCQAGYKGLWSPHAGFPSPDFLGALHPVLAASVARKLPGRFVAPGRRAGDLCPNMAERLGLREGTPVSAAIIDAHSGVPGAGVAEPAALVMVMGTSGCHMLLADAEHLVPGVAGVVRDGILPGFYGYETGQAAMGDAFDMLRRLVGHADFRALDRLAADVPPGSGGVLALDWFNGCRTPLMDGALAGGFLGLILETRPEQLYRAVLEASAFGLRWIVDTLRDGGVPVKRFVATGGLPNRNPLFLRIVASALAEPVHIHAAEHGPALGAAILGALAASKSGGGYDDPRAAVDAMAGAASALPPPRAIPPDPEWARASETLYRHYRRLAEELARPGSVLRALRAH